jgi:hypothetical protein
VNFSAACWFQPPRCGLAGFSKDHFFFNKQCVIGIPQQRIIEMGHTFVQAKNRVGWGLQSKALGEYTCRCASLEGLCWLDSRRLNQLNYRVQKQLKGFASHEPDTLDQVVQNANGFLECFVSAYTVSSPLPI